MSSGGGDGSEFEVNINLTALLDVLTNLLFFLMMGAAAQQTTIELDGGVVLPESSAQEPVQKDLSLTIGQHDVRVDKVPIVGLEGGFVRGTIGHKSRIETLFEKLVVARTGRTNARKSRGTSNDGDVLLVFCDKDTPYGLMHQVMDTAAQAGFAKFRMAVLMP